MGPEAGGYGRDLRQGGVKRRAARSAPLASTRPRTHRPGGVYGYVSCKEPSPAEPGPPEASLIHVTTRTSWPISLSSRLTHGTRQLLSRMIRHLAHFPKTPRSRVSVVGTGCAAERRSRRSRPSHTRRYASGADRCQNVPRSISSLGSRRVGPTGHGATAGDRPTHLIWHLIPPRIVPALDIEYPRNRLRLSGPLSHSLSQNGAPEASGGGLGTLGGAPSRVVLQRGGRVIEIP